MCLQANWSDGQASNGELVQLSVNHRRTYSEGELQQMETGMVRRPSALFHAVSRVGTLCGQAVSGLRAIPQHQCTNKVDISRSEKRAPKSVTRTAVSRMQLCTAERHTMGVCVCQKHV